MRIFLRGKGIYLRKREGLDSYSKYAMVLHTYFNIFNTRNQNDDPKWPDLPGTHGFAPDHE